MMCGQDVGCQIACAFGICSCLNAASLRVAPQQRLFLSALGDSLTKSCVSDKALPAEAQPTLFKEGYGKLRLDKVPEQFEMPAHCQDAKKDAIVSLEQPLHDVFSTSEIKPWQPARFEQVKKLEDAMSNHGKVCLMHDKVEQTLVAVKVMPLSWVKGSHTEFIAKHPKAREFPWQDLGCTKYLKSAGFRYGCDLLGVYRDDTNIQVVTSYANEGDLFSWCNSPTNRMLQPGSEREEFIRPIVVEMLRAVQQMHELSIVHHDISMENMLLSKSENGGTSLRIIDFGMATTLRYCQESKRGKSSYQAPEIHEAGVHDGFLSDAFSLGVAIYAICLLDYPWMATKPSGCKWFEYVRSHGFRAFARSRKLRKKSGVASDHLSEGLLHLLEGLLQVDPAKRLTLGESVWLAEGGVSSRKSIWDEAWLRGGSTCGLAS